MAETAGKRLTAIRQDFPAIAAALAARMDSQIAADGGPASPAKNDSASDVDTQPTPEEVIPVTLIPGETPVTPILAPLSLRGAEAQPRTVTHLT